MKNLHFLNYETLKVQCSFSHNSGNPSHFCPYYQDYENTSPTDRKSRLIMRGKGTMRLILNTRLFNDMMVTQANEKSIKLSASNFETGKISMYLRVGAWVRQNMKKIF